MSLIPTSSVHRALAIPELLSAVCYYLGPKDTLTNACVCKKWSNVALDALWREVDDLYILLSLLAPLEKTSTTYKFIRSIEPEDWRRFARYGTRVRALLRPPCGNGKGRSCHRDVFHEVARSRIRLDILPNLNVLEWDEDVDINFCVMFMHKNVKRFRVYLPNDPYRSLNNESAFFQNVVTRMPNLELLDISSCLSMSDIQEEAIQMILGLPKLKEVVFPLYYLTPKFTKALSRLPNLGVAGFQYDEEQGKGNPIDVAVSPAILDEGAFPALYDLAISMPFPQATIFFDQPFAPQNLTMLFIDSALPESPSDFHKLLTIIAKSCPLLETLALNPCLSTSHSPPTDERVTYDIIRPIFSLPNLVSLDLNHVYPFDLKFKDIEELASKWPNLKELMLNSDPVILDHPPTLTLTSLLPFAKHCPNLRRLGLYMNASPVDLPPTDALTPFESLSVLSVGLSSISEHEAIALFLSYVLPFKCELESGGTWNRMEWEEGADGEYYTIHKTWSTVGSVLPLLQKVRIEERKRYNDQKVLGQSDSHH